MNCRKLCFLVLLAWLQLCQSQYFPNSDQEELCTLINEYRVNNSLTPIPFSLSLMAVGEAHCDNFAYAQSVGTYGLNAACNMHSWYDKPAASYSSCCYYSNHSNSNCMYVKADEITASWTTPFSGIVVEDAASAGNNVAALNAWIGSPSHLDVILNQNAWASYTWDSLGCGSDGAAGGFYFAWFSQSTDPNAYPYNVTTTVEPTTTDVTTTDGTTTEATTTDVFSTTDFLFFLYTTTQTSNKGGGGGGWISDLQSGRIKRWESILFLVCMILIGLCFIGMFSWYCIKFRSNNPDDIITNIKVQNTTNAPNHVPAQSAQLEDVATEEFAAQPETMEAETETAQPQTNEAGQVWTEEDEMVQTGDPPPEDVEPAMQP